MLYIGVVCTARVRIVENTSVVYSMPEGLPIILQIDWDGFIVFFYCSNEKMNGWCTREAVGSEK